MVKSFIQVLNLDSKRSIDITMHAYKHIDKLEWPTSTSNIAGYMEKLGMEKTLVMQAILLR